eukprot:CAMPEP_0181299600 /NCGR_PEP_ID=MMETSP1101-20121128/6436_1 /TAXON_ID=46948 /ORGANISM="Rhodomonas abbreviata, Strain Caron Lab Isolate" /LENGTH=459 /DNA_ID=CAMNT_0023404767 /DNA_START=192 /DNA_END=1572 /DNA_ORIENTATION=+
MATKTAADITDSADRIVICGGGIIAAAIAYYLSLRGQRAIIVERCAIANAASGKAGGFLAGRWGDDSVTEQLHRKSLELHELLAKELGVTSFRRIDAVNMSNGSRNDADANYLAKFPWLDRNVGKISLLDSETAQVTPRELTEKLVQAATEKGADVIIGNVTGVVFSPDEPESDRHVEAVTVDGQPFPCAKVIIAMGPWSCLAEDWFSCPIPMEGVHSTSVIFQAKDTADSSLISSPAALFCAGDDNDCHLEVYPRPNGDVYICGIGGNDYLNSKQIKELSPEKVEANPSRVVAAEKSFGEICSIADCKVDIAQACLRPCPPDALPLLGQMPRTNNAYIASGHNCWGILWAPVTGMAISELILDGQAACVDLKPFDPSRFVAKDKLVRRKRRGRHLRNDEVENSGRPQQDMGARREAQQLEQRSWPVERTASGKEQHALELRAQDPLRRAGSRVLTPGV